MKRRDVRLVGGASRCEGELEVMHQSQWRPISYSYRSWREQEAGVACRQLGCGALAYTGRAPPPAGPHNTWRFLTDCGGAEAALTDCGVMRPQQTAADAPVLVICSDILLRPNISMASMMAGDPRVSRDPDQDRLSVFRGHSFTITCSVRPQYPGGTFNLHFAGTNRTDTYTQPAVNHTAHFPFPAARSAHQGNYTCVYLVSFHATVFTSESAVLFITIWKCEPALKLSLTASGAKKWLK
ncbi:Antigen WC1.1 [Merluccius polli]|uniref:Antigen WC1.1 n=1 Tax=Merluccius polli TaxID=89951 RepID=A0AA47N508_MERPO|nr:Antigen WC1.1 [Merluccius polli]